MNDQRHPVYPTAVFPELTDAELKAAVEAVQSTGISMDRLSAHICRVGFGAAVGIIEDRLRDGAFDEDEIEGARACLHWLGPEQKPPTTTPPP